MPAASISSRAIHVKDEQLPTLARSFRAQPFGAAPAQHLFRDAASYPSAAITAARPVSRRAGRALSFQSDSAEVIASLSIFLRPGSDHGRDGRRRTRDRGAGGTRDDNARLYQQQRSLPDTMQRSLLACPAASPV
jgi:hypothetical protein